MRNKAIFFEKKYALSSINYKEYIKSFSFSGLTIYTNYFNDNHKKD